MKGKEVEITKSGDAVTLRPISAAKPDWKAIFAELDAIGPLDDDFMSERFQEQVRPNGIDLDE